MTGRKVKKETKMTDPAQIANHMDPNAFVQAMLDDAEAKVGEEMYLDGGDDVQIESLEALQEDEALNDMEEVE